MSNNNKGKFKDRLKRMKLYRIAKFRNMVLINGILKIRNEERKYKDFGTLRIYNDNMYLRNIHRVSNVAISTMGVGSAIVKSTIFNTSNNKAAKKNNNIIKKDVDKKNQQDINNSKFDVKDNNNNNNNNNNNKIPNSVKTGMGIGIAVAGAVVSNLIDDKDKRVKDNKNLVKSDMKKQEMEDSLFNSMESYNNEEEREDIIGFNSFSNSIKGGLATGAAVVGSILSNNKINKKNEVSKDKSNKNIKNSRDNSGRGIYKAGRDYIVIDKISDKDIVNGDKKTYLANQIIKKIKKQYEKKLNEIEVLESELYLLDEKSRNELDLEKCKKIRKEINDMIKKINHIIEQYNIYKSFNFDIDMLDIDDISDFKRIYETADIKRRLVSDYELISEYQNLYYNLDNIRDDVILLEKNTDKKINDLDDRDKKIRVVTKNVFNIDEICEDCVKFLENQDKYLNSILDRINHIDVDSVTNYRLNGFTDLLFSSVRYLGLLSISPLAGFVPGIAISTLATRNMIHNLRNSLSIDRITSTVYRAEDFRFELNKKLYDIDYNVNVIQMSLDDIKDLKKEFLNQYNYKINDHHKILSSINKIESSLYRQKDKLAILKKKMEISKKSNEETLNKVRVLEKESRPVVEKNV